MGGHSDRTLPWEGRGIPDLQACILLGLQEKCLGGRQRWQDLTTVPGTSAVGHKANLGKGPMPGSSHWEHKEGQVFVPGWSPALQGGTLTLQEGLGVSSGTQSSRWDLVLWQDPLRWVGFGVLGELSAPGDTQCSRSDQVLQVEPSAPGSTRCSSEGQSFRPDLGTWVEAGIPGQS